MNRKYKGIVLKTPQVDQDLIDYLRAIYPIRLTRDSNQRSVDWAIGQQEVIEHLASLHAAQNDNED